ncbi:hypothetical protein, partial [uncultured Bilophila sp.]
AGTSHFPGLPATPGAPPHRWGRVTSVMRLSSSPPDVSPRVGAGCWDTSALMVTPSVSPRAGAGTGDAAAVVDAHGAPPCGRGWSDHGLPEAADASVSAPERAAWCGLGGGRL